MIRQRWQSSELPEEVSDQTTAEPATARIHSPPNDCQAAMMFRQLVVN